MHRNVLTAPEQRVLGCLIEKRFATPEQYPLTLNALRTAANQATNRWPVTAYEEETVYRAAQRLCQYGLARLASGHSSRAIKYRHLAEEALGLGREELAVLAVLLLRGPQTPGELKARSERMAQFATLEALEETLERLAERGYARGLPRQPGQKEVRWVQLLGEEAEPPAAGNGAPALAAGAPAGAAGADGAAGAAPVAEAPPAAAPPPAGALERRVVALEAEVAELRAALTELRAALAQQRAGSPADGGSQAAQVGSASPTA